MIKPEIVRYLNNMANMISSYAGATGSSVMAIEAYDKKNYARDFAARYDFPLEKLVLTPTAEPLRAILARWLRGAGKGSLKDRMISSAFLRQLRRGVGTEKMTLIPGGDEDVLALLSKTEGEDTPRYIVDELAFAIYEEGALCFLLGHKI